MKLVRKSFAGREFVVVDPSSIGLPQHTTVTFDDHEPCLALLERIKPGEVFVDAGACFGSYTLPALAMGATVVAYEPADDPHAVLVENVAANGWQDRCQVRKAGLWDGSPLPGALIAELFGHHYPAKDVRAEQLDELALDRCDWLKSDVEGMELGLLRGALETISRFRPTIIIENHEDVDPPGRTQICDYPKSVDSSCEMRKILTAVDYEIEEVPWDVSRRFWVCRHASRW